MAKQATGFIQLASELAAMHGPIIITLPNVTSAHTIDQLLALEKIAGVIISRTTTQAPSDPRIGEYTYRFSWRLPHVKAECIADLNQHININLFRLVHARRAGIKSIIVLDADLNWHRYLISFLLMRAVINNSCRVLHFELPFKLKFAMYRHRIGSKSLPANTKKNTVMLFNNTLGPGGAERQLVNTANHLLNTPVKPSIMLAPPGHTTDQFYQDLVKPQINIAHRRAFSGLPTEQIEQLKNLLQSLQFASVTACLPQALRKICLSYAIELLIAQPAIAHFWQDETNVLGGLAAHLVGIPKIIISSRNVAPNQFAYYQPCLATLYRYLLEQPNVIMINNSHAGARSYANWLNIPAARIQVVHNGCEPLTSPDTKTLKDWQQSTGLDANKPVVGCLCRFVSYKSPLLWLKTAAEIVKQQPDAQFLLVGDGPMKTKMQHTARALGIDKQLIMPGQKLDCSLLLASMNVFLLTSKLEGLPNVLIEAQMLGIPVVTTNAGGSAETLFAEKTGYIVDPNPKKLAQKILDILDNPDWCAQAKITSQEYARQHFSIERMIRDTLNVYGIDEP